MNLWARFVTLAIETLVCLALCSCQTQHKDCYNGGCTPEEETQYIYDVLSDRAPAHPKP